MKALHRRNPQRTRCVLVLAAVSAFLLPVVAPAQDYSLDYALVGVSAQINRVADYDVVEQVGLVGAVVDVASSADYIIVPVHDVFSEPEPVVLWMIY